MAEYNALYHQQAVYYAIALERDVTEVIDFVKAAYHQFTGGETQSLLDVCCGPAYHAREAARQGLKTVGLDFQPDMLELARQRTEGEGLAVEWAEADMRCFRLEQPVDVALGAFDAIDGLLSNEDVLAHLHSVAANLTPKGLYVFEHIHPLDCSAQNYGLHSYTGERDGIAVEVIWGTNNPLADLVTSVIYVEVEIRVNDHGHQFTIRDAAYERIFTPQEIVLLAELSGVFRVAGWYGDYKLSQPFDYSPTASRMVCILQRIE